MKKISILFILCFSILSCSETQTNLTINGKIKGLKKGTVYLQKIEDTSLVTLDSILIDGDPVFTFETFLEDPQVLYLHLNKLDGSQYDDRFLFFAEPGEMTINTTLENFETDAVVAGSKTHKKLLEYKKMIDRFNSRNLDLIKENLEAQKEGNMELVQETSRKYDNLLKRRYLFTVNYALNNNDSEIAPYLAISEVFDANIKYLDTIYSSLTPRVQDSKYGQSLKDFLEERRAQQNKAVSQAGQEKNSTE